MKDIIYKILLFSDSHYSLNSREKEEKWFPPLCKIMPKRMTKKFLQFWDNVTQNSFEQMLVTASVYGPYDLVIGCGDYTPGTNESGMITDASVGQYHVFNKTLDHAIGHAPRLLVWGDHDTGYYFDVSGKTGVKIGTEAGGMSVLSTRRAEELIGPAFGVLDVGVKKIVYISTNLVRNVDSSSDAYLRNLQKRQEKFVDNVLSDAGVGEIIFCLHDPTAIDLYGGIGLCLKSYTNKIEMILHGHLHARWNARLMRIFYKPYRNLCKQFRVHVIPASWGMMGLGKGFGIMWLTDDGELHYAWKKV